jgi:uroporphyrinogen decarboxylase
MPFTQKTNLLRALYHAGPDHVPWAGEGVLRLVDHVGRKPPRSGVDDWGVTWAPLPASYRVAAGEPAESYPIAHPASTAAEALTLRFPDSAAPGLFAGLLDGIDRSRVLVVGQHGAGPFDRFVQLLGMPAAMIALLKEPEASADVMNHIAEYHVGIARGYLAAGTEAGWLADDYAGDGGPLINPVLWRKRVLPAIARIITVYREAGAPVFFHTCGRAEAFVQGLLEAGVTALNLQSELCDLAGLKAQFGRQIAFYGGVPSDLMLCGTTGAVCEAARHAMRSLGSAGGLILTPDQPLAFPPENMSALDEVARQEGKYPLRETGCLILA